MRRLFLTLIVGTSTFVFGTLAILGCLVVPNGNPLLWCARPWAASILLASGVRVHVRGRERVPRGPVLYVTNHQSHYDVLALVKALPGQYRIVAKKELFAIPVFGWALSLAGFIKIDRADRDKAIRSLDKAAVRMRRGHSVVMFAEGTRSEDGHLRPFKKGGFVLALSSGFPIVPVTISGSRAVLPKGARDVRAGEIDVVIGGTVESADFQGRRDDLIAATRASVEAGFTERHAADLAPAPRGASRATGGV